MYWCLVYQLRIFFTTILFVNILREYEMCFIIKKKSLINLHEFLLLLHPFFEVHDFWASFLEITKFDTGVIASLNAKCAQGRHKIGPKYANDDELIIPGFPPHYY